MVVVRVGAVCVYFDLIEANVLCHLLDARIDGVWLAMRAFGYGSELLFGRNVSAIESRLFTSALLVMRHIYLSGLLRHKKFTHLSDDIASSSH